MTMRMDPFTVRLKLMRSRLSEDGDDRLNLVLHSSDEIKNEMK